MVRTLVSVAVGVSLMGPSGTLVARQRAELLPAAGKEIVSVYRRVEGPPRCRGYTVTVSAGGGRTVRRRLTEPFCGSAFRWLRAGRLIGGRRGIVAVDVMITPSIGDQAWVLSVSATRLATLRTFSADRIRTADIDRDGKPEFVLRWLNRARSPGQRTLEEVWRYERGAYRLWRTR